MNPNWYRQELELVVLMQSPPEPHLSPLEALLMFLSSSTASAVIFISVGLQRTGGDQVLEWAVIPIHWPNLISPTVPSYYTLHPPHARRRRQAGKKTRGVKG